jgi:hypothetical protein
MSSRRDFLEAWIVVPSGSTIVDSDQNGSRRAETAGIAADPIFGEVVISLRSRLPAPGFLHGRGVAEGGNVERDAALRGAVR